MTRQIHHVDLLMFSKVKFAVIANILLVLIIFYNLALMVGKGASVMFSLFLAAMVYFIAASSYSLYIDVIKK